MRLARRKSWTCLGLIAIGFCCWIGQNRLGGAVASSPADSALEQRYRQAIVHFKAGRGPEALAGFEAVASESTGYLQLCATNMIGQMARLQGRAADAREAFARMERQARAVIDTAKGEDKLAARAAVLEELAGHYQLELAEEEQKWDGAVQACDRLIAMARQPGSAGISDLPSLVEKRARLSWRLGRRDEATQQFNAWLEQWPDHPRSALVRRAVLSLEQVGPADAPKLAPLFAPLCGAVTETKSGTVRDLVPAVRPGLPDPPHPELDALDRLLDSLPAKDKWKSTLLVEKGWMACDADGWQDAETLWADAARTATVDDDLHRAQTVRDYAELSRALWLYRQGRLTEAGQGVTDVLARSPRGHAAVLASSIRAALSRRTDTVHNTLKCDVKTLQ